MIDTEKYNLIIPYIRRAEKDLNRHRKIFTQSVENNKEKLLQWINYLTETDIVEAALAITDLTNIDEDARKIVLCKTLKLPINYYSLLTLLYLGEHNRIITYINSFKTLSHDDNVEEFEYAEYDEEYTEESILQEKNNIKRPPIMFYEPLMISIELKEINNLITRHLVDKSNYKLIMDYVLDLSKSNMVDSIYNIITLIDKIVITDEIKNDLQEIINNLLIKEKYLLILEIINILNLRYDDYVDMNKSEFSVIVSEKYACYNAFELNKKLYLETSTLKNYFNSIKDNFLSNEFALHMLKTILELSIDGENINNYEKYIRKISEYYSNNNLYICAAEINNIFTEFFNLIIEREPNNLINIIKLLDCTNPFKYTDIQKSTRYIRINNTINNIMKLENIIGNITSNDNISTKDKIYIYINSHIKILIDLSSYLHKIININNKTDIINVKDLFNDYFIYARIIKLEKSIGRVRLRLINLKENNKIRASKSNLEKHIGCQINPGLIFKTKIESYVPYNYTYKLEYISADNSAISEKNKYIKIYEKLANNYSITQDDIDNMPSKNKINFNSGIETERLYDLYCNVFNNISNNHINLIKVLKNDKINPFKWPSNSDESIESDNLLMTKKRIKYFFGKGNKAKEDKSIGYQKRSETYKSLKDLIECNDNISDIIYIYMNSFYKYNTALNDFIRLLISKLNVDHNNNIDLYNLFKDYEIYGKMVDYEEENKIALFNTHLLWTFNIKSNIDNPIALTKNHKYIKFHLDYYNIDTNTIYVKDVTNSKKDIVSPTVTYLTRLITNAYKSDTIVDTLKDIKTTEKANIFGDDFNITKQFQNQITDYVHSIITTINYLLPKKDCTNIIYDFIKSLGDNNIFKYPRHIKPSAFDRFYVFNNVPLSLDLFKQSLSKQNDIDKLLYIYFNTHFHTFVNLNEVLKAYCANKNIINQEIDLNNAKTEFEISYEGEWQINHTDAKKLVVCENLDKNKTYIARINSFHSGTNEINVKVIKEKNL